MDTYTRNPLFRDSLSPRSPRSPSTQDCILHEIKQKTCAICLSDVDSPQTCIPGISQEDLTCKYAWICLPCGHNFHTSCFKLSVYYRRKARTRDGSCPICREKFPVSFPNVNVPYPSYVGYYSDLRKHEKQHSIVPEILVVSRCNIYRIPNEIQFIWSLRELALSGNYISNVPDNIFTLPNLTILNLSNNRIRKIDIPVEQPTQYTSATSTDEEHRESKLEHLDISMNLLKSLPDTMLSLTSLRTVVAWKNGFDMIPPFIKTMNIEYDFSLQDEILEDTSICCNFDSHFRI